MKKQINEIKRMQLIAGLITESEYQEALANEAYSTQRVNPRDNQVADDVVNHEFDTVDIVPLDNGNKIEITTSHWYRDPGVKGYSSDNSKENPGVSKVKAVLLDPSGKKISSKTFTDPFLIKGNKKRYIPQIIASFEKLNESSLNEAKKIPQDLKDDLIASAEKDFPRDRFRSGHYVRQYLDPRDKNFKKLQKGITKFGGKKGEITFKAPENSYFKNAEMTFEVNRDGRISYTVFAP